MADMRVTHTELLRFASTVFVAAGMSAPDAATVAGVLVWANERGVDSHGVVRIPIYLKEIEQGLYKPTAKPVVRQLLPATFMLDCDRAPGPVCMMAAAARAVEVARTFGVGVGVLSDPTHLGALGHYAQWVAERGLAALVIVAGLPFVAYHGARVASIATSPIAIGIPAPGPEGAPLLLDMATSVTTGGHVSQAAAEGKPIPEGAAIDVDGKPTTDASKVKTLLPIGGAKGSGLSLMFECLTGILVGTPIVATLGRASGAKAPIQNAMIIVFDVASFRSLAEYRSDVQQLSEFVKALPRREGFSELLLPGERGDREAALRRRTGIPLPARLWSELGSVAQKLGVAPLSAG
jgi:ureidoglycolate dehydrogenase (NAD+)